MRRYLVFILLLLLACSSENEEQDFGFEDKGREVPVFSADTAYSYIEDQLAFGPRNPNSEAHKVYQSYLRSELEKSAGKGFVFSQDFEAEGYDETLQLSNILASFNPNAVDRIMIAAHYDTRPRGELDEDPSLHADPILGADDGASGVAVILELARLLNDNPPPIGVDFMLFDGEDYGKEGDLDKYFLGSREWSINPPVPGYSPRFGVLLDMVGGEGATFPKEVYSLRYAKGVVDEIWDIAAQKGYDDIFLDEEGAAALDDHVIVNQQLGIPFIDIIRHSRRPDGLAEFAPYWHTQNDNLDIISKETLQAVGDVLAELIYNRL